VGVHRALRAGRYVAHGGGRHSLRRQQGRVPVCNRRGDGYPGVVVLGRGRSGNRLLVAHRGRRHRLRRLRFEAVRRQDGLRESDVGVRFVGSGPLVTHCGRRDRLRRLRRRQTVRNRRRTTRLAVYRAVRCGPVVADGRGGHRLCGLERRGPVRYRCGDGERGVAVYRTVEQGDLLADSVRRDSLRRKLGRHAPVRGGRGDRRPGVGGERTVVFGEFVANCRPDSRLGGQRRVARPAGNAGTSRPKSRASNPPQSCVVRREHRGDERSGGR